MSEQSLAQLLHEAASQCSKGTKKILAKCQKSALKGKSSIRVKCSETDYECINHSRFYIYGDNKIPWTPLVAELREHGFHLAAEWRYGFFFGKNFYLTINW